MNIAKYILRQRKFIVSIFLITALISLIAQFFVSVNYSIVDYLPDDAQSTQAIKIMDEEFSGAVPNSQLMLQDITIQEALLFKKKLAEIDGVSDIIWLDDVIDLKTPLELADEATVESYYKDNKALFSFTIAAGEEVTVTDAIYDLIGEEHALAGEALNTAVQQKMTGTETMFAASILVPIIIIILILSTNSWIEPVFFLTAIGVSVLINLGTNIFLGEISYITQAVAPILQLAVSLDYAIFLLHSFADYKKEIADPKEAMRLAMKRSFPAIIASASTTFFGFMALSVMRFEIGSDLGINLVKGILLSFISVMVFLPALTLVFHKWIERTAHKPIVPKFKNVGKRVVKLKVPSLLIVLALIVPAFLGQSKTDFIYGMGEHPESTRAGIDEAQIEKSFGKHNQIVVLVPKGDLAKEEMLVADFENMKDVSTVFAYVNTVSAAIPTEFLDEEVLEQFYSDNFSRIIVTADTELEGESSFAVIEEIQAKTDEYYKNGTYSLGESVTLFDIKDVILKDNTIVNILTVATIAFVLLVTFRSLSFPILLLLTIQTSVWINLSIPYFMGSSLVYIGYLIISTVQLAATVDYAILLSESYLVNRRQLPALAALKKTMDEKLFAISVSASILSIVGFVLWITSSNPIVSSIGLLLGRGALLAFILVVFFLPAMLLTFDKFIAKTTWKANFYKET